jgi:hypothetical protein
MENEPSQEEQRSSASLDLAANNITGKNQIIILDFAPDKPAHRTVTVPLETLRCSSIQVALAGCSALEIRNEVSGLLGILWSVILSDGLTEFIIAKNLPWMLL